MNTRVSVLIPGLLTLLLAGGCMDSPTTEESADTTPAATSDAPAADDTATDDTATPDTVKSEEPVEEEPVETASTEPEPAAPTPAPDSAPEEEPAPVPESDEETADSEDGVVTFSPGPDVQKQVLEELILAQPGTIIQFEEGVYEFTDGLSLTVDDVTIRGRGMDKTILSFRNQEAGAEGLYITSKNVVVEDLAIEDTKGNAVKSLKADNIVYRRVRTEWTGGPKETNGAYGLYPVSSKNVLVEECVAIGASDAGIYVGQSINVIVRNCRAEFNVAGIEIENCYQADVYGCVATNNTGGILVFDLPDLPQQRGHDVRIFNNKVRGNNTPNFAPAGNIVATVPAGTGVEVMANSNVEIFDNEIADHGTNNVLIISYLAAGKDIKDPNYYPYAEGIHVHHNAFGPGGDKPDNKGGELMAAILGTPLPDIIWDGVANEANVVDGVLKPEFSIAIHDNTKEEGNVTFANLGGLAALQDPANAQPTRDLAPHAHELPAVAPVRIEGVE